MTRRVRAAVAIACALAVAAASDAAAVGPAGLFDGSARLEETSGQLSPPPFDHPHQETVVAYWEPDDEYVMLHRTFAVEPGGRQYLYVARATSDDGLTWTAQDGGAAVLLSQDGGLGPAPGACPENRLCGGALAGGLLAEEVGGQPRLTLVYESGAWGRKNVVATAHSEDGGITWEDHEVIVEPTETWEGADAVGASGVGTPSILRSADTYWIGYHGVTSLTGVGTLARGFAHGPALDDLEKQATPALAPGPGGSWTEVGVGRGDAIERDGWFYLAYEGFSGTGVGCTASTNTGWHVARAESPEGPWTDMPGPVPFVVDPNGACGNDMPSFHRPGGGLGPSAEPSIVTTGDIDATPVESLRRWSLVDADGSPSGPPAPPPPPAQSPSTPAVSPSEPGPAFIGLRIPPPTAGEPRCNAIPPRRSGPKGVVRLTPQALATEQRIASAALRRLNAVNAWIDGGIVPDDLCASAFGPQTFQEGILWAGGSAAAQAAAPEPRRLRIASAKRPPRRFTAGRRQVQINDTISRALLARARATRDRASTLTGGNLAPGADLSGHPLYAGLRAEGPLPASAEGAAARLALPRLGPRRVAASVAQVRRTQRRTQTSARLANAIIDRIRAGLTEQQFRPYSIGASRLG